MVLLKNRILGIYCKYIIKQQYKSQQQEASRKLEASYLLGIFWLWINIPVLFLISHPACLLKNPVIPSRIDHHNAGS